MKAVIRLFFGFLFCLTNTHAELAPDVYLEMQANAPEEVRIKVDAVKSTRTGFLDFSGDRNESVEATVMSVLRSESGLKAGDKIIIRYTHRKLRGAGPSPIPQLEAGATYPAWLTKNADGIFDPAAQGYSFTRADD